MNKGEFITFNEHVTSIKDKHRMSVESWLHRQKADAILRVHGGAEFAGNRDDGFSFFGCPPSPNLPRSPDLEEIGPFSEVTLVQWEGPNHASQFIECQMLVVSVSGDSIEGMVSSEYQALRGRMMASKNNVIDCCEISRVNENATDDHELPEAWDDELPL